MQHLLEQLWIQSDNCARPIEHAWFPIQEASKSAGTKILITRQYFNKLLELDVIEKISEDPLLFQFTGKGKQVKSGIDLDKYMS